MTVSELSAKTKFSDDLIFLALDQLKKDRLIDDVSFPQSFSRLSRREAIRKVGLASMIALPIVSSLVAPPASHAASCVPAGSPCTTGADCCSGICQMNGTCLWKYTFNLIEKSAAA